MTMILWWLAQNLVTAVLLAAIVAACCLLLRHRPAAQHALWVIVLLKFVTPPLVVWPWSADMVVAMLQPALLPAGTAGELPSDGRLDDAAPAAGA
jgi:hypothetical protein